MDAHGRQIAFEVCRAKPAPRVVHALTTGSLGLDSALGTGGLPRGYITEIFGPESCGKSTLALHLIAEAQARGNIAALIDAERSFDPRYAATVGVDLDGLVLSQPETGEKALQIVELLLRSQTVDLVAVDSAAALVPDAELSGAVGDTHPGLQRRMLSHALRRLALAAFRGGACVLFLNQLRGRPDTGVGEPVAAAGGPALALYAAIRVRLDPVRGPALRVTARVQRNRLARPGAVVTLEFTLDRGLRREAELLDLGLAHGLVAERNSQFSVDGTTLGGNREEAIERLRSERNLAASLSSDLRAAMGLPMPPGAFRTTDRVSNRARNRS
ncbi:MAG: recombinase RecA [Bryobacteraceae bacterium]